MIFVILAVMIIIPMPATFLAQYRLLLIFGLGSSPVRYIAILVSSGLLMSIFIMCSFFVSQPHDLEEAALDGAGPLRILWRVILSLACRGLTAVAEIQGPAVWHGCPVALVLFDDNELVPIQRGLTALSSAETPQQVMLAATAISIIPVIVHPLVKRHIVNRNGASAL